MKIYIICPVRRATPEQTSMMADHVLQLKAQGHEVFFPPDDVDQNDSTGKGIIEAELNAIKNAEQIHVFWDVTSSGSHFDLGMAYALGKTIIHISSFQYNDDKGKSYFNAILR